MHYVAIKTCATEPAEIFGGIQDAREWADNSDSIFSHAIYAHAVQHCEEINNPPVALGIYEGQVFGPYSARDLEQRELSDTVYLDRIEYLLPNESVDEACERFGV